MRNHGLFLSHARALSTVAAAAALVGGCVEPESTSELEKPVVYGADHRRDVYDYGDQAWAARAAEFTAVQMSNGTINRGNPNNITFNASTLDEAYNLCDGERFGSQITAGYCSATLIAPDLVLTAGHCIDASRCSQFSYVFDYYMTSASQLHQVTADDVYACQSVVARQLAGNLDYAIVRLDRPVAGRTPAPVDATAAALPVGTPLIVNGFGSGLPLKIDNGAKVRDGREGPQDYFIANLDTFGGNSGSGVFRSDTGRLVGILVRGETDYVSRGDCQAVNVCTDTACRGEDSTYAYHAIAALCAAGPHPLCSCGDGTCDAGAGETPATCPADCGGSCGDGICSGDENSNNCPADCGGGGEGDVCSSAIQIPATGTQRLSGTTATAHDDYEGTCVGDGAPDRVYAFTLTARRWVEAVSTGYDTGLYLRRGTCAGQQLACNDDSTPPGSYGSRIRVRLNPGTYYLFVDGYGTSSGSYSLSVTFTQ